MHLWQVEKKELLFKEVVEGVECSLGVDGGDVGGGRCAHSVVSNSL